MVDSNNTYTPEEKAQIKSAINQTRNVLKSLGKVSDKALPYIQLALNLLLKSG